MKFPQRCFEWGFYDPQMSSSIDGTDLIPHDRAVLRAERSRYSPPSNPSSYFIGHLPPSCIEKDLEKLFPRGKDFHLIRDCVTKESKGYAFANGFIDRKKEYRWNGHLLLIEDVASKTLKGWKPRRCGGGLGGKKQSGQLRFGGSERPFKKPFPHRITEDVRQRWTFLENQSLNK